jgi:hypothetical protein
MATVMAEKLQGISESRRVMASQIPAGVYHDALEFYRLVLEAAGDNTPVNPPASINAYALASDALRTVCADIISRADVEQTLGRQKALLENLQNARDLSGDELKTLSSLRAPMSGAWDMNFLPALGPDKTSLCRWTQRRSIFWSHRLR